MGDIRIKNLRKTFDDGNTVAVENLSFDVQDGEFLVVVGPSGCGKTTTLNCLAGLELPTSGQIYIDGKDVSKKKPQERDIAMVFQNFALYPHKTVRGNISFGLKMRTKLDDDEIERKVNEVAELLEIEELLDDKPKELSGGQQQRVALGRAITREPAVFLMDEPLSNLDEKLRRQMRTELQELQETLDVTTVYVTHDQTEAMTMGDRIAVLRDGELQQIGAPLDCYHSPNNLFVADFIGSPSMNFFTVTLDGSVLSQELFDVTISDELAKSLRGHSKEFELGIRPEKIFLTSETDSVMDVSISVVERMGDNTNVYFESGGKTHNAVLEGEPSVESGDEITLGFDIEDIHLFDASTGEAIYNEGTTKIEAGTLTN